MRTRPLILGLAAAFILTIATAIHAAEAWVTSTARAGDFALVANGRAATLVVSPVEFKVGQIAASDLAADIERVTGVRSTTSAIPSGSGPVVLIGTLGRNPIIDRMITERFIDVGDLAGKWESFVITTVEDPFPGVSSALAIVGSDRRGTAFGVYELSQAIGVSPWHWWADVTPEKKPALHVAAGTRRFGPPSVKYRGIFINDEDWGMQPWAAKTFEPETGDIGPKTYAKIFELMLRLKANTVWPAMHACTKAFNHYPQNKLVADDYAIVMGSSHAEPMLRNNVGEWTAPPPTYNYVTNREGVLAYWEQRVRENGKFENIYTLGMRGIHDSAIQGTRTDAERVKVLQQTFVDQRALIAKHVRPEVEQVPQMFCAYKEVLGLYRQGLQVPDDVTIVWPDDNHGYIRNFANAEEQKRSGGFGVYYHLSYLGAPMSYLWLSTTPPALVWEEMSKAYDHGARTIWIANVGDLKPAEIGTEFFLQMAWDIKRWNRENLREFLPEWAAREFGRGPAAEIAQIMADYYALNFQRRPEHLQWWLPRQPPKASALSPEEMRERLAAFGALRKNVTAVQARIPREQRDAFVELVGYPALGSAAANERFLAGEMAARVAEPGGQEYQQWLAKARAADIRLRAETDEFNLLIAGGKWRGFMNLEPADDQWKSFRLLPWEMPTYAAPAPPVAGNGGFISREAEHFSRKVARGGSAWDVIPGLGRTGDSVAVFPTTAASVPVEKAATDAPRLEYDFAFPAAGEFPVTINLLPTHALAGGAFRFALALDDAPPRLVTLEVKDGAAEWAQGVLNATRVAATTVAVPSVGAHTLRIFMVDAGVLLDKIVIDLGGLQPSYLGPPETKATR